ncbi:hypothetical protein [Bradyrhizobium sp. BWA-3-5]|uniref:hypothetical protein n=1 Tax=Bradyrhizobium sp. BWA-3-5 TaxID=3080013 RepID=UPI00293E4138|nr:hypothetical protein [Bradyrhizobium sp. BWA-3-5]WOH67115.1 hypothetical protein RX331_04940 [Bradyrhizobium sp. BWA-3-5]WOH67960.1 hypothetical protein RX331_09665 [Bradyrhizobium sp. BWA-3-5]
MPICAFPPRYAERLLFEEDFVVAMRKGHPLPRALSLTSYVKAQHLLVSSVMRWGSSISGSPNRDIRGVWR